MRTAANGFGRYALAGVEPPIEIEGRRPVMVERRLVSARWLAGTVLMGAAGTALIAGALYAALERRAIVAKAPEFAVARRDAVDESEGLKRGDRIVRKADIVAEKQSFQAPTTVTVGDKQVIRLRGYTRVATTLTMAPTDQADQVPPFNPLKLLAGDEPGTADVPADPGPSLDASELSFVTSDLDAADPARFGPGLSKADAAAQVAAQIRAAAQVGAKAVLALPAQFLLMRASRPSLGAGSLLAFASPADPFSSINVQFRPENVMVVPRSEGGREPGLPEDRLVVLRHGDALEGVLREAGAAREAVRAIAEAFGAPRGDPPVAEGRRLRLTMAPAENGGKPRIARLSVYADETLETTIALTDDGHYVRVDAADQTRSAARAAAQPAAEDDDAGGMRLYDSIYQTALKQQVPPAVIATMIRIFSDDIDFQQATQGGDQMDAFYADDEDGDGRRDLLYASVTVRNEVFRYYRFLMPDDPTPEYFDDAGRSMRKFLIRTPVPSGVFTSGFGVRFHPILGYSRPHTGVDWTAPVGTPILAAGNGTVLKAERSSSYGNRVEIQHANGYLTTYSHMVGFARGIADGVRVRQGQVVGYLGQTGLATGPHLHYEVIVNGRFVDPMRVKLARSRDIAGPLLADFQREHARIDALMASAPNAPQARASN